MSLRRVLLSLACLSLGLLSACVLRPRYKDMLQDGATPAAVGQLLTLRVVDPSNGQPIPGARVVAGAGRERLTAASDAQGRLSVPVSQALLDENPLVEVVLPKGVRRYAFQLAPAAETPAEAPAPAPAPSEAPAPAPSEAPAAQPSPGTDSPGATPSEPSPGLKPPGESDGQR